MAAAATAVVMTRSLSTPVTVRIRPERRSGSRARVQTHAFTTPTRTPARKRARAQTRAHTKRARSHKRARARDAVLADPGCASQLLMHESFEFAVQTLSYGSLNSRCCAVPIPGYASAGLFFCGGRGPARRRRSRPRPRPRSPPPAPALAPARANSARRRAFERGNPASRTGKVRADRLHPAGQDRAGRSHWPARAAPARAVCACNS